MIDDGGDGRRTRRPADVLLVSTKLDVATDAVVRRLKERGADFVRINTEDIPFEDRLSTLLRRERPGDSWTFRPSGLPERPILGVRSIWYRRVRAPGRPTGMSAGVHAFCVRETQAALLGALLTTQARIMSPPRSIWAAEHKLFQLAEARLSGLRIPETVVSNDPREIRAAFKRFDGRMVAKAVRSGYVEEGQRHRAVYTSQVLDEHLRKLASARWSSAIYQPMLEKACDVRATVVGSRLFVAEIDSQSDPAALVDWRRTARPDLPHRRASLPNAVRRSVLRLTRRLGLAFAAVDFVRTPTGEYFFLELNPSGQWLWLEDKLGFDISGAVADWLVWEA